MLVATADERCSNIQRKISEPGANLFEAMAEKFDVWAEDLRSGLERETKNLDGQITTVPLFINR